MLDYGKNVSNILGAAFFEKFEFEPMKSYNLSRVGEISIGRSKLVKRYGQWWMQQMDSEEWDLKKKNIV